MSNEKRLWIIEARDGAWGANGICKGELVRCKDCKHLLVINGNELYATCRKSVMQFDSFGVDTREFYCAYGERIEHEQIHKG